MRLAKTNVRSLAKSLGSPVQAIDLLGRLAMGIGLVRAKIVSKSGRGRNQTIDEVWNPDEQLIAEWNCLTPSQQWLRLLAEWCRPQGDFSEPQVINRHLVLWELANLEPAAGWTNPISSPSGSPITRTRGRQGRSAGGGRRSASPRCDCLIRSGGPDRTRCGCFARSRGRGRHRGRGSTQAIVQADHRHRPARSACRRRCLAGVHRSARKRRRRVHLPTRSAPAHRGRTSREDPESILEFLTELSSVPLAANISGWCGTLPGGQEGSG